MYIYKLWTVSNACVHAICSLSMRCELNDCAVSHLFGGHNFLQLPLSRADVQADIICTNTHRAHHYIILYQEYACMRMRIMPRARYRYSILGEKNINRLD